VTRRCNKDRVNAWDEGVAFYTGSLEGPDVTGGSGKLLHGLADKRYANYITCTSSSTLAVTFPYVMYHSMGCHSLEVPQSVMVVR